MDEQVIDDLYKKAQSNGYAKSREEFIKLLHIDSNVFADMYSYVKSKGYQKDETAFSALIGKTAAPESEQLKKKVPSASLQLLEGQKPSTELPVEDGSLVSQKGTKSMFAAPKDLSQGMTRAVSDMSFLPKPIDVLELSNARLKAKKEKAETATLLNAQQIQEKQKEKEEEARLKNAALGVSKSSVFQDKLKKVDASLIDKEEEDVVPYMNQEFGKFGFVFEETGTGDAMIVRSFDGKHTLKVDLDPFTNATEVAESAKLRQFLNAYGQEEFKIENEDFLSKAYKAQNLRTAGRLNPDGTESTVKMTSFEQDGKFYAIPTLFPKDPNAYNTSAATWQELPFEQALKLATERGEVFQFGTDKEAKDFANGSWKDISTRDIEADKWYKERGLDYITEKKRWDKYKELDDIIDFVEGNNEEGEAGLKQTNPELFIKGKLRGDAEQYIEKLKQQRDALEPLVKDYGFLSDGKSEVARMDWDAELAKREKKIAAEAIRINNDAKAMEYQLDQQSITQFGIPAKDILKYKNTDPNTQAEFDRLQKEYYVVQQTQKEAATKFEIAKTYFDGKADKQVNGEFKENLRGFWNATTDAYNQGQIGEQLLSFTMPGGKDVSSFKDRKEAAEYIAKQYADMSNTEDRAMARWRNSRGFVEGASTIASDPFEILSTWVASSLSQILPYGTKIVAASTATGAGVGAISGAAVGGVGAIPGAITGGGYGFRAGMAMTNLASEYTNAVMAAVESNGYNPMDPESLAEALSDQRVWDEGRNTGLVRGIPIAVADMLTAGLAGRVFKPASALASRTTKIALGTAERIVFDPLAEGAGELTAQAAEVVAGTGRKKIGWNEIAEESLGGLGSNTINWGINSYKDIRNKNNVDIANTLTQIGSISSERASDEKITSWANNMLQLKKIDADVAQRINENVGLRREARDLLEVGGNKKANSEVLNRTMELLSARNQLSSTQNRREIYRSKIQAINEEIATIGETKALLPTEKSVDLSTIIGTTRQGTSQYSIDGRRFTKEQFIEKVNALPDEQLNRVVLGVKNDPETGKLIKSRYDAIQKSKTDAGVLRTEESGLGLQEVGEGNRPQTAQAGGEETIPNAESKVLSTVEDTFGALSNLPAEEKSNLTFTNEKGEEVPVFSNEKSLAELYHQGIAVPEEERTASQQSAIDAVEVSLKTVEPIKEKIPEPVNQKASEILSQYNKGDYVDTAELESLQPSSDSVIKKVYELFKNAYKNIKISGKRSTEGGAFYNTINKEVDINKNSAHWDDVNSEGIIAALAHEFTHHALNGIDNKEQVDTVLNGIKEELVKNPPNAENENDKKILSFMLAEKNSPEEIFTYAISNPEIRKYLKEHSEKLNKISQRLFGIDIIEPQKTKIENNEEVQQTTATGTTGAILAPNPVAGNRLFNKPLKTVSEVASRYFKRIFGTERPTYAGSRGLDEARAKRISDAFIEMKHDPSNPEVKAAYEALVKETIDQYQDFLDAGFKVEINNEEPYANSQEMVDDLRNNNRIKIFSTESGFGSNEITDAQRADNPLLRDSGFKDVNGKTLLVNDVFRAIHDFYGHAELGNSFGPKGEENAWNVHVRMFSPEAARAMTTETRGQNSYVNFSGINEKINGLREEARLLREKGDDAAAQKISDEIYKLSTFADQKIGLLPEEFSKFDVNDKGDQSMLSVNAPSEVRAGDMQATENVPAPTNDINELMTADTKDPAVLEKIFNALDKLDKNISKGLKGGLNDATRAIPLATMQIIVKSLKALVKGGMLLQDAIKKVAADNNVQEADVISSLTIINNMESNVSEGLSEAELPGYDRMMGGVDGIIEKSTKRGVDEAKIADNVMQYVMGSKVYENATDVQREKLVRAVNGMFGVRQKSAPSVGRILGTIKDIKKITMSEREALKKQLKDYERGAKNAKAAWVKASTDLTKAIKDMATSGKLTVKQVANVLRRFSSVNMFNEDSIDKFVDYMANVFEDAEYADKINIIKNQLPTARKNVKTKLGAAMNLIPAMERLFSINPNLIPMPVLNSYMLLVDMMGKRQETLDLKEINVVTRMTNAILDMVDEEQSQAEELADRFDWYSSPVVDADGKIKYADTINAMLKDGTITEDEAELMRKYKNIIMPRPEKAEMTEQEIADEKQALVDSLNNMTLDPSKMASIDDRGKSISLKELLKTEAIKRLNAQQLKNLIKVVSAINNGYFPHSAQLVIERLNAINNAISLVTAIQEAKPLPLTKIYARIKNLFTDKSRTPIQEMVIRGPLYFIDQLFGDFKTKRVFNAVFNAAAQGQAAYDAQLNRVNRQIDNARNAVAKSFGMNPNKTIMSSYKMMAYMIQNEFLSNPDSDQVNPAHKYLAETIKFLENDNRDAQANMLQDILDNYTDADGNIDADELYDSFNKAEREALKVMREINDSLTDKAVHTAGVIRGSKISPLNNYVHMPVITDFDTQNTTSITAAADAYNRALMPSTKGKSLIERDGQVHPLNFDVFASAQQGAKSVLMDYNLTEPIRTARKTLAEAERMMAESGRTPKEKRQIFGAIKKSFNQATEDLLLNNYIATSFGDDVMNFITKQGYRAILASVPRFITELTSNIGYALISDPRAFTAGLSYQGFLTTPGAVDVMNNVRSKQIGRLFHGDALSGRFVDTGILSQKTGIKAGQPKGAVRNIAEMIYNKSLKKYKNAVELTADTLISTPDKLVMRPIWFGAFANKFESITGTKVDFEKIAANDESYMNQHKAAIEQATTTADDKSVLAGATDNAYMGILKGKSPNQSAALKAFHNFNNFMTRFAIYEYTAARTGIYAMVGKGSISKKDGAALLAGVTTRMVVYSLLTQMLGTALISAFSDKPEEDEEDEDEKTLLQKFGQAFTSATTGMLLGRDFGNATRGIINYGVEEMNEKFLTGLRNGEYDPYKDAIAYSIVPKEKKGHKTNLSDFLTVMGGSMGPSLKTLDLMVRKATEAPKKEEGAIQRQKDEIEKRIPLEVLGNLGFIPLYKDVRKVVVANIYSSLKEEQTSAADKKSQKEAETYLKNSDKIEALEKLQRRSFNSKIKEEIENQISILSMSEEDKKAYDKENEGLKELKKSEYNDLLQGYDNETDMKRYNNKLWLKTFGPNSSYYKENKVENEVERLIRKELKLKKDREYNYKASENNW